MTTLIITTMLQSESRDLNPVSVNISININASVTESFEYIVPVELSHIFKPFKNLPGVKSTSNKEIWYTPGMQRTVFFDDGESAQEYLLEVNPHSDFSYKIDSFTSSLRYLAKRIEGKWGFKEHENRSTSITWTYSIVPKSRFAKLILNLFVKKQVYLVF